jgi:hypothetical protein
MSTTRIYYSDEKPLGKSRGRPGKRPQAEQIRISKHAKAKRHNGKREPVGTPEPKIGEGE